jgi:hypothetical protein
LVDASDYFISKQIVPVDGESASAAEVFARVAPLEKRSTVIGGGASGARWKQPALSFATPASTTTVTASNTAGCFPDEVAFPLPLDLSSGRDPVMARAAQELGVTRSPEDAGKLFPYEWPKE